MDSTHEEYCDEIIRRKDKKCLKKKMFLKVLKTKDVIENEIDVHYCVKMNIKCKFCKALHFLAENQTIIYLIVAVTKER